MDRTVPLAAARMLDFVRATEVGTDGPSGYNVIFGFNQDKLPKPVTQMTIDEVLGAQASWSKRFGSSAAAGYQFMRATLTDLKRELGLRGTEILDEDLQDRLAFHLLKRRGYEAFMAGQISRTEFGKRLAQEWASFPVLASVKGPHRQVARGQSYYTGDPLNKALVSPEEVERVIDEVKELGNAMPAPAPVPIPKPEQTEEPTMPAPIGHNGGPELSPIEQMNKPVQGAKAGFATSGVTGALLYLWSTTEAFPAAWQNDTQAAIALTVVASAFSGLVANFIASYLARDKRFTAPA
ncbi:hypothetical protein [Aurantimonas endophytica]|uniref:Muramidase (Phage lysozyme) n=1 Tax=Aurantimonas endophytica TaxID=1522175 RepID=A0A7W6MN74_9HYPH|nr:hypothetical protein [Aurantimonas endophytica]MBB4001610.1 muramidase (phage lysozyme) [Aurantimonas endophytica]MCO6402752.1 hypothetical protein [Aurantimonas endophytica]